MRFESVKAHAFGPFRDETLELASGMNVVHGPNEAGKSSWHAALYAGLCGMRRGKGGSRKDDQEFAARHRPWNGGPWEVGAVVVLDAGRRVELRHDLAERVGSARDAERAGLDYSNEIIHDGAPDGSVWLGLNRRAFLGTACVRQADMVEIRPEMLQEGMQRAAATAGADETAARALDRLDSFRKDAVGSKNAPKKPLRQSETRVGEARTALSEARAAHESCLRRRAQVDRRERDARDARRKADAVAAALAEEDAVRAERRLQRARERTLRPVNRRKGAWRTVERELAEFDESAAPPPPAPRTLPLAAAAGLVGVMGIGIAAFLPDFRTAGIALAIAGIAGAAGALLWSAVNRARRRNKETGALWDELQRHLERDAKRKRAHADGLTQQLEPDAPARAQSEPLSHDLLESLRGKAGDAKEVWNVERGQLAELEKGLPGVADAEDDLAAAQHEMERVRRLDTTLERTIGFLEAAQEKVHRNVALALKKTVTERLPRVTGGRYADCWIDPATLLVEVAGKGGPRRNAALLSHGTAEQVYLLLRLALARHLTAGSGETCPLILDDPAGASDGERKRAVLDTLLAVSESESTQVILFTHEDDVRDWARGRLAGDSQRLVELDRSGIPA